MIVDRRKFVTKRPFYGMSSFYFYRWNQFNVIPLAYPYKKHLQIYCDVARGLTARQITLTSVSRKQLVTIDYRVT